MLVMCALVLVRVGATPALSPAFPAPERLMVDYILTPALGVGSPNPLFTFSPVTLPDDRNVSVADARVIVVSALTGKVFWDSGYVTMNGSSWGIRCSQALSEGQAFSWTASWRASDGRTSAVSSPARFVTDIWSTETWDGASWVGAGHGEFRARFNLDNTDNIDAFAFVASPGGVRAIVYPTPNLNSGVSAKSHMLLTFTVRSPSQWTYTTER